MIDYILTLILSFAGIILGGILALIATEELKSGEKYFKILEWVFIVLMVLFIFYFSQILLAAAASALLIILKIFKKEYPAMAFVLLISHFEKFLFFAGALIFLYGLASGTLQAKPLAKSKMKALMFILRNNILYLIFGFILLPFLVAYS